MLNSNIINGREYIHGFKFSKNLEAIINQVDDIDHEIITNLKNKLKDIISSLNTSNENFVIVNFKHSLERLVDQMETFLGDELLVLHL